MHRITLSSAIAALLCLAPMTDASHIPGQPCNGCASHEHWPKIRGKIAKAKHRTAAFVGTRRSDELLGHHGSDRLMGKGGSDVLWGDWDGDNQPTDQRDVIHGGWGRDFIYASHGRNRIFGGANNDAISAHFGRGLIDCGPGRDIVHVPRSRKRKWRIRNCEKIDRRTEAQRGGGLRPLP